MKITVDGKVVEAIHHAGSELWTLANGEIRHLKQDYSSGIHVYNTVSVIKEAITKGFKDVKSANKKAADIAKGIIGKD